MNKTIKHLVSAMAVAGFLLLAFGSDEEEQEQTNSADTPNLQIEFEKSRNQFYTSYENAPNEIKKSVVFIESKSHTCEFESRNGRSFENWTGVITSITTNQGGSEVDLYIKSKSQGRTITYKESSIQQGTTLYNKIAEFNEGDNVYFTFKFVDDIYGLPKCFKESSVTELGSLEEPEFEVSFSNIKL